MLGIETAFHPKGHNVLMLSQQSLNGDRRAFLVGLASAAVFGAGCGAQDYERRLDETKKYFDYLEQANQALTKSWKFDALEIRVPKQFEPLIAPPAPADGTAEGQNPEVLDPSLDPNRLGYFPNVVLEGVVGTWRAKVRVDVPGQQESNDSFAYLHVLSNWQRWIDKQTNNDIEPPQFLSALTNQLANVLNVEADSTESPWLWDRIAGFSQYVPKKRVDLITVELPDPAINITFYKYEARDIHVAMLLVLPRAIDVREKIDSRMKFTLETLKVAAQPPQKKSNKPAAVGGF